MQSGPFKDSQSDAAGAPALDRDSVFRLALANLATVEPLADTAATSQGGVLQGLRVVIETPRGSRVKYKFDESLRAFTLKAVLPVGMVFPFNFGFVPKTLGGDGDPLDALVLMEEPLLPGCVVSVRVLGVMEVEQIVDGVTERNDRLLTMPAEASLSAELPRIQDVSHVPDALVQQLSAFFVQYHRLQGKSSRLLAVHGAPQAEATLRAALERARQRQVL